MTGTGSDGGVGELVENLFRRQYGRMVARLVRILGPRHLSLAEEVVQEALMAALQNWPFRGVPRRPEAWLVQVARNRALDALRRHQSFRRKQEEVRHQLEEFAALATDGFEEVEERVADEQLRMMFLCCQPGLSPASSVALILKTVCGFGVSEIARALLSRPEAVAQRLVRAKRSLRTREVRFEMPAPGEIEPRLELVLAALYSMFTEGYWPQEGDRVIRGDVLREAVRLTSALAASQATARPSTHALLALMLFLSARIPARLEPSGELQLLADQDRRLWDRHTLLRAFAHFEKSISGGRQTSYHLQAAIAALHASAADYASTDWESILRLYDQLLEAQPSPIVRLNRCVALSFVEGPDRALACLKPLEAEPSLRRYHLLPAAQGALCLELGDAGRAARYYREALERPCSRAERRFLRSRLRECEAVRKDRKNRVVSPPGPA